MQEGWVTSGEVPLFVRWAGSGDTIICLHGFPESGASWARQLTHLRATHRVLAPDGRGHGRSGCPSGGEAYRIDSLVADVLAVADQLEAEHFTLVGHDWGGVVAWCAAAWHPQRVSHLVAINAPHPTLLQAALDGDPEQQAASAYIAAFTAPDAEARLTPGNLWQAVFAADEEQGLIDAAEKAELLAAWSRPGAIAAMLNWYRSAPFDFWAVGGTGAGRLEEALQVTVPTCVLWGMEDRVLLPNLLAGLEDLVPDLTLHKVEGAGHGLVRERPELVSRAIADHLSTRTR
ncbi:MAG TPA: alpha/beta hydrolase [Allosphingosinicella sp.]|nr:alpha/beta hydrolase [Allosphingosinicella sp.]